MLLRIEGLELLILLYFLSAEITGMHTHVKFIEHWVSRLLGTHCVILTTNLRL